MDRKKIRRVTKEIAIWVGKDLIKPKLPVIISAILPPLTLWFSEGKTFFWSSHLVPGWAISALGTGSMLAMWGAINWLAALKKRPKWLTWQDVDFQFLPPFFEKTFQIQPELESDLWKYVKGPFCRNPRCRRELEIIDQSPGQPFDDVVIRCQCSNQATMMRLGRVCSGTHVRAVLGEAMREGQAAMRRRERFRSTQ